LGSRVCRRKLGVGELQEAVEKRRTCEDKYLACPLETCLFSVQKFIFRYAEQHPKANPTIIVRKYI
jgi:hypothetical protein